MFDDIVEIEVTADDIANGKRQDERCCPIALACRRTLKLKESDNVYVSGKIVISNSGGDTLVKFKAPAHALDFICDFDRDYYVSPITFEMKRV